MVVSRRRASACCSCSWSPARESPARTAQRPPLWQDMQGPWRAPAMNVGTTPAEVRGIKKLDDGRRMPRLVYGLVYKGLSALPGAAPYLRLSCKCRKNERADERTRTADLLITSDHSGVAGVAGGCKCRIFRGVSFLWVAECCTVLRSRWYQSGIRTSDNYRLTAGPVACSRSFYRSIPTASLSFPRPPTAYAGTNASNIVNAHTRRTTSFTLRHGNISVPAHRGQPLS